MQAKIELFLKRPNLTAFFNDAVETQCYKGFWTE
jgi:hypothetical protein